MSKAIKLLVVEDSEDDARLVIRMLKRGGFSAQHERVESAAAMAAALQRQTWDAVVSDYNMPGFSGLDALRILRATALDIPFILISGTVGEEIAVDALKAGANDYVIKNNLSRLALVLERELKEAAIRAEHRRAQRKLMESEAGLRHAQLMAGLAHVITGPDGAFETWSESLPQLIGLAPAQMPASTREWLKLLHPEDRAQFRATSIEAGRRGTRMSVEYRLKRADGAWIHIRQEIEPLDGGAIAQGKSRWFNTLQDVTAQKQAAEALRESEARHRAMFEQAAVGIVHTTLEGDVQMVNPKYCDISGYTRAEAVQLSIRDLSSLEDVEKTLSARARILAGTEAPYELEPHLLRKDGSAIWVHVTTSLVRSADGRPSYFISVVDDISERKRAEEELRRFRLALDNAADIIFVIDRSTMRHVDVNLAACKLLGYTREELLRLGPQDVLPVSRSELEKKYDELIANPAQRSGMRSHYRCKDGSQLPFESTRHVLRSGDTWLIAAISRDIRERLAAETALRESEARFRSLSELSSDWFWQQDAEHRFAGFSGGDQDGAWGSDQLSLRGLRRWELPGVVPVSGSWDQHKAVLEARKPFRDFEYQRRLPDGTLRYVTASGEPVFDAGGRFTGYRGVATDITGRKRAEHELQRFRMAMDVSADSIYLTDPASMRFVYLNNTACRRLGYTREQLLQKGPQDVLSMSREQISLEYDAVIAAGDQGLQQERRFVRSDGSEGWTELHRQMLRTEAGTLIVTIGRDITERKIHEERIDRLTRMHRVLSGINAAIVRIRDRTELFQEACRIAVDAGHFKSAWLCIADRESMALKPVAWAGHGAEILKLLRGNLSLRDDAPEARGIAASAVRDNRPVVVNDVQRDPLIRHKQEHADRDIRSIAILPLVVGGQSVGAIGLHSDQIGFFDDEEMKLLLELSGDLSFALDNLEKAERLKIEAAERLRAETSVKRLNRVHAVLSGINALIVRVRDRDELFKESCRVAVEAGGFPLAWMGVVDREAMLIKPVAWYGTGPDYTDYIGMMRLGTNDAIPEGRGLAGRAVLDRKAIIANDVARDPRITMKKEAYERGFHSLVILPLLVADEVVGVLAMYVGETGFFDEEEMKLLHALAGDISFALDNIEKKERLDYLAFYDQLTGLANRPLFLERLNQSIHFAVQVEGKFAVAILDLERLRTVNESLGRQAGDALLKLVAERLNTCAGALGAARISADHFALVLGEVKGRSQAGRVVSETLQKCFGEAFQVSGTALRLAAKAGVALYPGDGVDAETLLGNAEAALRKAKDLGERHVLYTAALTERTAGQLTLENQLRQALEKEEFVLHYQPKVDLEMREIVGVEALIRWQSPTLGLVPPMKFIPLLEETGLILEVGSWALKQASLDHRNWVGQGLKAPRVAVNVSPIQLRQRDFVAAVERAIMEGVAPTGIDLEITESLIMEDVQGSIEKLKTVRGLGVRIAIDDFGTGYSSLGYLAKLPVQTLKIDRSFIITMLSDPDTMTLVSTIISLAHSLRLKVVAEGVDAEEQAKMLRLLRCDQMQGYLFSKPLPFELMTAMLKQEKKV